MIVPLSQLFSVKLSSAFEWTTEKRKTASAMPVAKVVVKFSMIFWSPSNTRRSASMSNDKPDDRRVSIEIITSRERIDPE